MITGVSHKLFEKLEEKDKTTQTLKLSLDETNNKLNDLTKACEQLSKDVEELDKEISNMKQQKYVTLQQINEVVEDVQNSFAIILNATPRPLPELEKRLIDLEAIISQQQEKLSAFEVIKKDKNSQNVEIPKLNIKKKT